MGRVTGTVATLLLVSSLHWLRHLTCTWARTLRRSVLNYVNLEPLNTSPDYANNILFCKLYQALLRRAGQLIENVIDKVVNWQWTSTWLLIIVYYFLFLNFFYIFCVFHFVCSCTFPWKDSTMCCHVIWPSPSSVILILIFEVLLHCSNRVKNQNKPIWKI